MRSSPGEELREFLMEGGNLPFTIINQIALASNNTIALRKAAGRILTLSPKMAAGHCQNPQAGRLRYVAQPSRLRVRVASQPRIVSCRIYVWL